VLVSPPAAMVPGPVAPVIPALPLVLPVLRASLAFRGTRVLSGRRGLLPVCRRWLLVLFCHNCQTD